MTGRPGFVQPPRGLTVVTSPLYYAASDDGCWIARCTPERSGYTRLRIHGRRQPLHRAFYELFVGPIPHGLHLDHLCCVPPCVNPAHLEPVTPAENQHRRAQRQTHCVRGHPFDDENTYLRLHDGGRGCRACGRFHHNRYNAERRNGQALAVAS